MGWTKAIVKFMLETRVNKWKYRCELNFQPKIILHNNEYMSFHKHFLLIIVDHFFNQKWKACRSQNKNGF